MTHPVPSAVRGLVLRWRDEGSPPQSPIRWPKDKWIADFPEHGDRLSEMPRLLGRADVRAACHGAVDDAHSAEAGFIAASAWGYGIKGYGRSRTRSVLDDPRGAGGRLLAIAQTLAASGPKPAHRRFGPGADSALDGLGTSFGTKYLYFCQPPGQAVTALILDALVSKWFRRETDLVLDSQPWSATTYGKYLDLMHEWATQLGCRPDDIEWCIFREMATGQWRADAQAEPDAGSPPTHGGPGARERLIELRQLHDEGLITEDEYAAKRAEILKDL